MRRILPAPRLLARLRQHRSLGGRLRAALAAGAVILSALPAHADDSSLGSRQTPLALAPEYESFAVPAGAPSGALVVATREGLEVRLAANPGGPPIGAYRGTGAVRDVAAAADRAFLFQGAGGVSWIDISNPADPRLLSSMVPPLVAKTGAVLDDGTCVAASDSTLQVIRVVGGTDLALGASVGFTDGRKIARVRARGDSVLVVAARPGVLARLYVTLYRVSSGSGDLLRLQEWLYNGRGASDAVWSGPIAFLADGNAGVHVINVATGSFLQTQQLTGSRYARSLDASAAEVIVASEAGTYEILQRQGALGETLAAPATGSLELEPVAVAVLGGYAVLATRDVVSTVDPDEIGRSQLEFVPLAGAVPPTPATVGSVGRSRRLAVAAGLVYVADYTGGLRIYRAGGADTTLVGVLPPVGPGRVVDIALDAAQSRVYLASGPGGLEVVDVSNPAAPVRLSSFGSPGLPGLVSAVTIVNPATVAVARRGGGSSGVTLVDVSTPTAPFARGSVNYPTFEDPRALALRDTVLFVADEQLGVISVGIGNLDAPAMRGVPSGAGARDLQFVGTILLVSTRGVGLQVVEAFDPVVPVLRSQPFLPPMLGAAGQGGTAVALLGSSGAALLDISQPIRAAVRSIVASPGMPRSAAWIGDTLLIATGTSIERFILAPQLPAAGGLGVSLDPASALPRAVISWTAVPSAGQVGWSVYRDLGPATSGTPTPGGLRLNEYLLPTTARGTVDVGLVAGQEHRYRLEASYDDGRLLTVAEGSVYVPSNPRVGRPYPNPFRAGNGGVNVPYRAFAAGGAVILRVVDVRGRLVREISSPPPGAGGFGEAHWDGKDRDGRSVPTGVYYLYVRGPGLDDARPVVHIR